MSNYTKLGNFITNDYDFTNKLFEGSEVLSRTNLSEAPYVERSHVKEGTYSIKLGKEEANMGAYKSFLSELEDGLMFRSHTVKTPTFEEFLNRKYEDGRKIGKQLAKDGCPQFVIDKFSAIEIVEDKEIILTITGAPQFMIGVSAFSTNRWDSYSGSSCLDVTKDEGNQIHVLGLLTSPKFFVAFTHDSAEQLENMDNKQRIMNTRVILFEDENGELHFNSKAYGSGQSDKVMLKKALKETGLAKGVVDIYIDEDYLETDSMSENGLDYHSNDYLADISKGNVSLKAKLYENVFEPIEVGVRGAYDIKLGQSKIFEDTRKDNVVKASCPCCRPYVDGLIQEVSMVTADFHDYRHDDGGVINGVELDLNERCPVCDNQRNVEIEYYSRWGSEYQLSNIPSTWGDNVDIKEIDEDVVTYETGRWVYDSKTSINMLRTYGIYDEGTFHLRDGDFILIYDENEKSVKEEVKESNRSFLF